MVDLDDAAFSGLRDGTTKPDRRVTSIDEALGTTKRAFIRGEAGSGKTTLPQWLAVRCGRGDFDGALRDWNGCVPLCIRLRRYSGADTPVTSLDFLSGSSRLERPHIGYDGPLPDLTPLCELPALRFPHSWGEHPVNLSALSRATNLEVEINGNTRRPVHGREKLPPSVKVRFRK